MNYLFLKSDTELATEISKRFTLWSSHTSLQHHKQQFIKAYEMYYGEQLRNGYSIGYGGEQDEYSLLNVNHSRSIIKNIIALTLQNKVTFNCAPTNSDFETRNNAITAESVLEHFFQEKRFEVHARRAFELGLFSGTSFIYCGWKTDVNPKGVDPETGDIVYAGEPELKVISMVDCYLEPYKDNFSDQNYFCFRVIENRHDLMSRFPALKEEIANLPHVKDILGNYDPLMNDDKSAVWVFYSFHKPTPSLPMGRMHVCCEQGVVLLDDVNPYEQIPVVCYRPEIRFGSAFGHTPFFDLIPLQESLNILDSAELTIAENFSIPTIVSSANFGGDSGVQIGGLKHIIGTADPEFPNGGVPQPINMPKPDGVYAQMREARIRDMEMLSGINSTVRGQVQVNQSGTAIALTTSAAQSYNSVVESGFVHMLEDLGMLVIKACRNFMMTEDIIAITGRNREYAVRSYNNSTFNAIQKVSVKLGNPFSRTLAGRVEIGEKLLQYGAITPDKYVSLLESGNLQQFVDPKVTKMQLLQLENEQLMQGQLPIMSPLDNHIDHINHHHSLLDMPQIRTNSQLMAMVLEHIQEHLGIMTQLSVENPSLLQIALGQTGAPQPQQPAQEQPPPEPTEQGARGQETITGEAQAMAAEAK